MIAGTLADNLPLHGARRVAALAIALLLAASLHIPSVLYFEPCVAECGPDRTPLGLAFAALNVFCFTSAIAVACFARRRDQQIATALHASELARVGAERARLQSELQTMQARVEPAFLLNALHDVGTLYESDRKAGGRMLDLLIQHLRAALPQMRQTHSTLEREIGLLRSYLGILALQSNGKLTITFRLDETLADARIPPMMLVPLVAAATPGHSSSGTVKIDATLLDGRVRITLTAQDAIATSIRDSPALSEVSTRLKAIYDDRATFAVERNDGASRLILEIPYERTSSSKAGRVGALAASDR
jgi:LytS/YehU family sensor histidine kinase